MNTLLQCYSVKIRGGKIQKAEVEKEFGSRNAEVGMRKSEKKGKEHSAKRAEGRDQKNYHGRTRSSTERFRL